MNEKILKQLLACPRCKKPLTLKNRTGSCHQCKLVLRNTEGIWHGIDKMSAATRSAQKKYDALFTEGFSGPADGSYEILASFARGGKSIDIACGPGLLERLSPHTVGVDFSLIALKSARKRGARYLVLADTHALPFVDNAFEVAISSGNLEHFSDPQLAISEMARVSKIQILTVHRFPPLPFAKHLYQLFSKIFHVRHQPIEQPFGMRELERMCASVGLHLVFKGVWTLPFNYGRVVKFLPELKIFPSAWFIISVKI